jgi:hypothetical protein
MQPNLPSDSSFGSNLAWMAANYRQMGAFLDMLEKQAGAHQQVIRAAKGKNTEILQMLAAYKAKNFSRCR